KKLGKDAHAMTITLLLNSEGKKMGKTQKGAVWLDPEKTSPYDFFQYWRNVNDADVIKCMKMLTFMPLEEIYEYERLEGSELNKAKEKLAYELTALVHGKEEAEKSLEASRAIFSTGVSSENMPTTEISESDFTDGKIFVSDLLVISKLAPSKGEAKRLIMQGGITVNGEKKDKFDSFVTREDFNEEVILKKGKKSYQKIIVK
ncbi:MAG: tyrosine--tRNA ligase, partial [Ruminococcaceae bacterium]|nr:tyrosine--tRNA ligase [Oscillospiraceae bacterium]